MSSTSESDARRTVEALKELLRERGITYARLAEAAHCSLPTVKRALNKPSLPLTRLLEFCEIAELPFQELVQRAEELRPRHHVFTDEQDDLFAERKELLAYLLELARPNVTPSDVARRHDLDRRSTTLYLKHLAKVGLVQLGGANGARLLVRPPFGFGTGSRVLRQRQREFMRAIAADVLGDDPAGKQRVLVLKPLRLSQSDYGRMIADMLNIVDRFAAISERGLSLGRATPWQVALACGPGPESRRERLPRITR